MLQIVLFLLLQLQWNTIFSVTLYLLKGGVKVITDWHKIQLKNDVNPTSTLEPELWVWWEDKTLEGNYKLPSICTDMRRCTINILSATVSKTYQD